MYKTLDARKPVVGVTDYPTKMNALIDDLKNAVNLPGLPFSFKESTTSALILGYFGGQMSINGVLTTIADGTVALTGSVTNYIEHDAAGAVSNNTTGWSAGKYPIAEVATDAGSITGYTDRRNLNTMLMPGRVSIDVAGGVGTTVLTAQQWHNDIIEFSGVLTGNRTIEVPTAVSRPKAIYNATSGAFTLTVKTNAGTGKEITQGSRSGLYCDGTNVELLMNDAAGIGSVGLTGNQTVNGIKTFGSLPVLPAGTPSGNQAVSFTEGVQIASLFGAGVIASGRRMRANIATVTASTATFEADELVLRNGVLGATLLKNVNVTPDLAASGANGLDTGVEAISTWYYLWVLSGTSGVCGIWSASSTAPTLPAGYTSYAALVSAAFNDAAGNLLPSFQRGNQVFYRGFRNLVTNGGAVAETALPITTSAPPNALSASIAVRYMGCTGTGGGQVDITTHLRHTSGHNFASPYAAFQAIGVSVPFYTPGPTVEIPYTGNLYYLSAVGAGSAPTATIDCLGFTLPMGGQ